MIGPNELLIIGLLAILLFGASKLPEIARSAGRARVEFKKGEKEAELELIEFEKKLKSKEYDSKTKLEEIARDLEIETENKSDEEILEEINRKLRGA